MSCISSFLGFFFLFSCLRCEVAYLTLAVLGLMKCELWTAVWNYFMLVSWTPSCSTSVNLWNHISHVIKHQKHSNFNSKINFAFQWQILTPNLCMGLEPSFLHFWSQFKISKVQAVSVSPPHTSTATTSAEDLYRCLQASFSNSIRFAYSAEANVFMVCHLDFIKGVGPGYYPVLEKSPIEAL